MKNVNILVGRFQPFTNGHYKCIEAAWNTKRLPTVICMIDTPEAKVDKRHPFPSDMLLDLYSNLINNDKKIADIITVKNANIIAIAAELKKHNFKIASWTCGTDRYDSYNTMAEKYHDAAELSDDFEVIEVKRSDEDVSATKARNCLLNNDRKEFISMMPAGIDQDKLFDVLKDQLETVYSMPEPEPKKSTRKKRTEQIKRKLEQRIVILENLILENRIRKLEHQLNLYKYL